MADSTPKTIVLLGSPKIKEAQATAAISPGHLVEYGGAKDIRKTSTALVSCRKAIALENDIVGKTITDAYAANDWVRYGVFTPGDVAYVRVAAAATAIAKGDKLVAHSDGTVKKTGATTDFIVGYALEALDNSAGGSEAFIKMEVA